MTHSMHSLLLGPCSKAVTTANHFLHEFNTRFHEQVGTHFLQFSLAAEASKNHIVRVYCVFCWIVFSPSAQEMAMKADSKATAERFQRILCRTLLRVLHGISPSNGQPYTMNNKNLVILRKMQFFVAHLSGVYCLL